MKTAIGNILSSGAVLFLDTCTPILQIALSAPSIDPILSAHEIDYTTEPHWCSQSLPCDSHHFHSSRMIPSVQELLNDAHLKASDLKAIAVSTGPGSFTGLRTGVVTARTLAQFLPISIYAFNSLELHARHLISRVQHQQQDNPCKTIAVYLDALRGRAFKAVYQFNSSQNELTSLQEPQLTLLTESPIRPGVPGIPSSKSLELPKDTIIIAPPSLHPWLEKHPFDIVAPDETFSTTQLMRDCLQTNQTESHRVAWGALSPLYLQEPSITLKPGFVPLTPSRLID
jgi:tRNA threonylcarbamoyl adenosine modification protein YeaZ